MIFTIQIFNCKEDTIISAKKNQKVNNNSYTEMDVSNLPELSQLIFGIEPTFTIPDTKEKKMIFDELSKQILVLNFIIPNESIKIIAKDPDGEIFSKEIFKDKEYYYLINSDPVTRKPLEYPILSFYFNNQSCFNKGNWEVTVIVDKSYDMKLSSTICFPIITPSVLNKEKINPFDSPENSMSFSYDDTMYIYGTNEKPNNVILVALYMDSQKINDKNESILIPVVCFKVKTDNQGNYKIKYIVSDKLPKGNYSLAAGEKIRNVYPFEGHFIIK
jgi:hypothetical protein